MSFSLVSKALVGFGSILSIKSKSISIIKSNAFVFTPADDVEKTKTPWNHRWQGNRFPTNDQYIIFVGPGENDFEYGEGSLTELGEKQAEICGAYMQKFFTDHVAKFVNPEFSIHYANDKHCKNTAKIFKKSLKLCSNMCAIKSLSAVPSHSATPTITTIVRSKFAYVDKVKDNVRLLATPKISADDYFINELSKPNLEKTVKVRFVICNADLIRYLMMRLMQLPVDSCFRFSYKNCGLTMIKISAVPLYQTNTCQLSFFNDTGFLDVNDVTYIRKKGESKNLSLQ